MNVLENAYLINEKATFEAADQIKACLSKFYTYEAYDVLGCAEVAIITRPFKIDGPVARILSIVLGMQTGQALEAIRRARKSIYLDTLLNALIRQENSAHPMRVVTFNHVGE